MQQTAGGVWRWLQVVSAKLEGEAVEWAVAVFDDGSSMFACGVAHVAFPAIGGIVGSEAYHEVVAIGLGQDAGSGDRHVFAVAANDGAVGDEVVGFESVAVNDDVLGLWCEACYGAVHGQDGCVEDVDVVYLGGADAGYGPCCGVLEYDGSQQSALSVGELLGVVEHVAAEVVGQYYCGGYYGSCQAAASGLVAAALDDVMYQAGFEHCVSEGVADGKMECHVVAPCGLGAPAVAACEGGVVEFDTEVNTKDEERQVEA